MTLILEPNDPAPFTGAPSFAEVLVSRLRASCTPKAAPYPNQAKEPDSSVDSDMEDDLLPEMEPVMTFPEVDGLRRDQKPHPIGRDHHDDGPIARTISAILMAVVAPSSRIVIWPMAISIGPKGCASALLG